jgi:putative transposase
VLGVSPSGYYARRRRPPSKRSRSDAALRERIWAIHARSRGTYGAPRIHAELAAEGVHVGRKRVARLMRAAEIAGVSRRRSVCTTLRAPERRPAPDLVERDFTSSGPDRLWVADITYVPTWAGFLYLAVVLDAWSRRVIGWAMATHLRTELVLDALNMALERRRPGEVIHHSDQGTQYTSLAFGARCREAGVRPSMGSVGDAYDNAMCESFFATLECELLERRTLRSQAEGKMAIFEFIEGWYNPHRRHSALGYESPMAFERLHREDRIETRASSDSSPALEKTACEDALCCEISTGSDLRVGVESVPEATRNAGAEDRKIPSEGVGEESRPEV